MQFVSVELREEMSSAEMAEVEELYIPCPSLPEIVQFVIVELRDAKEDTYEEWVALYMP